MASPKKLFQFSREGVIRLIADAILVNVAFIVALFARLLYIVAYGTIPSGLNSRTLIWQYIQSYGNNALLLTIICLTVFTLSGFYTYGRLYQGRYKFIIVIQAVSLAYLIFGLLTFLSQGILFRFLGPTLNLPRGAMVLAWFLTMTFIIFARAWSMVWKRLTHIESQKMAKAEGKQIQRVLVIGGAGYIGSALIKHLLQKGYKVRVLDLLLYGNEPINEFMNNPDLEIMQADFRSIDKVVEAIREVNAVVHLGAIVGDPACALDENLTIDINLMATRMIAEVAKGSGVDLLIFASTCSVYGTGSEQLDEKSELNPVSLYARSKIASEKVLMKMADDTFSPVILRFGTIYGLSGRTRFDLVINLLTAKALVDKEITIYGGSQWRPFLHVDDAARAIVSVLDAPKEIIRNQIFNVGSNEQNYTINKIGEIVQNLLPETKIIHIEQDADLRNYWVNFNKIRGSLGFLPHWTVEDGIKQVIDAIRNGKVDDYRNAKYSNVKFLSEEGLFRLARTENGWAYQLLNESMSGPPDEFDQ
jgi:nucleoside-diphosphate-sugar epimerase/sorbitol-specific phosphotransferase system component IIC